MSHGFDKALVNRERNREKLSEVLDQKYEAEARGRRIRQMMIVAVALVACAQVVRSDFSAFQRLKPMRPISHKQALEQLQKQIAQKDAMMIGALDEAMPTPAPSSEPTPRAPRAKRENSSYGQEQVPLHLYAELRRKPGSGPQEKNFASPSTQQKLDLENLGARAARKPRVHCAQYRTLQESDLAKLPPVAALAVMT